MIHKLLMLAVTAVAVFAFSAVSASAVVVENPGMYTIEGENSWTFSSELPEGVPAGSIACENTWEANISDSGHVEIHDINLDEHTTSSPQCDDADDCPDFHWEGQVFEDYTNPATSEEHEFGLTQAFCFVNFGVPGVGGPSQVTCEIDNSEIHCEHVFIHVPQIEVELHGELMIHPNDTTTPGFMHEEA